MVSNKLTTGSTQQAGRYQSDLDWTPKQPTTQRSEYSRLMDGFSPVWGISLHSSFGPVDGGAGAQ